jgi:anti-sigma B factor antagonist
VSEERRLHSRPDSPLEVVVRSTRRQAVIELHGELDLSTVGLLESACRSIAADIDVVVVDLRPLEFMDSVGIRALLELASWPDQVGTRVAFVRGSGAVGRVLAMTGLDRHLPMVDDVDVALAEATDRGTRPVVRDTSRADPD